MITKYLIMFLIVNLRGPPAKINELDNFLYVLEERE